MARLPTMVSFVAPSGTGKTTLIEGVIRVLRARGLRVAVVKHDAHRLSLDQPGKDSYRYRRAGAWRAVVASDEQLGIFSELEGRCSLGGLVSTYLSEADLVLTEGFRSSSIPALRVHRSAVHDPAWEPGNVEILAWASDSSLDLDLPLLPLNSPETVADFLVDRLLEQPPGRTVTGLLAALDDISEARIRAGVEALQGAGVSEVVVVRPPGFNRLPDVRTVADIRPGLGPLGALLTGLAAANTSSVLFLSASQESPPESFLQGLLTWGATQADVVAPRLGGRVLPLPGLYGHRCLSAIQESLLSGEGRLDGWWAQVRVHGVAEDLWRPTNPSGIALMR